MKTVLGYTQSQIKLKWLDDLTLQVTVEGKIYIGQRANIIEEIEVPILFAGEDATARRLRLIEIKESKQNWWMYDIPTD